jgi:hypothetical protein
MTEDKKFTAILEQFADAGKFSSPEAIRTTRKRLTELYQKKKRSKAISPYILAHWLLICLESDDNCGHHPQKLFETLSTHTWESALTVSLLSFIDTWEKDNKSRTPIPHKGAEQVVRIEELRKLRVGLWKSLYLIHQASPELLQQGGRLKFLENASGAAEYSTLPRRLRDWLEFLVELETPEAVLLMALLGNEDENLLHAAEEEGFPLASYYLGNKYLKTEPQAAATSFKKICGDEAADEEERLLSIYRYLDALNEPLHRSRFSLDQTTTRPHGVQHNEYVMLSSVFEDSCECLRRIIAANTPKPNKKALDQESGRQVGSLDDSVPWVEKLSQVHWQEKPELRGQAEVVLRCIARLQNENDGSFFPELVSFLRVEISKILEAFFQSCYYQDPLEKMPGGKDPKFVDPEVFVRLLNNHPAGQSKQNAAWRLFRARPERQGESVGIPIYFNQLRGTATERNGIRSWVALNLLSAMESPPEGGLENAHPWIKEDVPNEMDFDQMYKVYQKRTRAAHFSRSGLGEGGRKECIYDAIWVLEFSDMWLKRLRAGQGII